MNKIENKFIGLCLAKNNYFAATICRLEELEGYANVYVMVNEKIHGNLINPLVFEVCSLIQGKSNGLDCGKIYCSVRTT